METLWVDFQNSSTEGVRLICNGTLADIKKKGIKLYSGRKLLIWTEDYDDDGNQDNLSVEATVGYSDLEKCWFAHFDYDQLVHESERKNSTPRSRC
jgi:hypothetical protein